MRLLVWRFLWWQRKGRGWVEDLTLGCTVKKVLLFFTVRFCRCCYCNIQLCINVNERVWEGKKERMVRKIKKKKEKWERNDKEERKRGVSVILILSQTDWLKATHSTNQKEDAHIYTYIMYVYIITVSIKILLI